MSSTMSKTEFETIPVRMVSKLKQEAKPRLVRSSSIEKIRRFNTYICSQHFFILPALLNWLKTSHTAIHSQTEKTIFLFRSVTFNSFVYKFFLKGFKYASATTREDLVEKCDVGVLALQYIITSFLAAISNYLEVAYTLQFAVYVATILVFFKLTVCFYLLSLVQIPAGLYFLIACVSIINLLYYKTVTKYRHTSDIKNN